MANYKVLRPENRDAWLESRNSGIGSSEVASILGVNPWMSSYQLWQIKTGKVKPVEDNTNLRLSVGHDLEARVASTFEAVNGYAVDSTTEGDWVAYNPEKPYLRVSPDRIYSDGIEDGILEIKTTVKDIDVDNIPLNYFCQVQYQLAVLGLKEAHLAWINMLTMGANYQGYGQVRIERNDEFCGYLVNKVDEFWRGNVLADVPPAPTSAADVAAMFPKSQDKAVEITDDVLANINLYHDLQSQVKGLQEQMDAAKNSICAAFGDADRLVLTTDGAPKVFATYKTQTSGRVDTAKLKKDFPEVYEKVLKESTSRVLRLK